MLQDPLAAHPHGTPDQAMLGTGEATPVDPSTAPDAAEDAQPPSAPQQAVGMKKAPPPVILEEVPEGLPEGVDPLVGTEGLKESLTGQITSDYMPHSPTAGLGDCQVDSPHPQFKADDTFSYRPDVDGLRAVAVTAVIIYHINSKWLPGGFVGVDVFFVISGYVVCASLLRKGAPCREYLVGFYARRAKRLVAALVTALFITSICTAVFVSEWYTVRTMDLKAYLNTGLCAVFGMANNWLAGQELGYFAEGADLNPFLHTWSLGVEEQFYFFFPFLLWLVHPGTERPVQHTQRILIMCGAFAVSLVLSAALCIIQGQNPGTSGDPWRRYAFYLMPSRFWELASGALLFEAQLRGGARWRAVTRSPVTQVCSTVLLCVAFATSHMFREEGYFPFPGAIPAVGGALCFITAGARPRSRRTGLEQGVSGLRAAILPFPNKIIGKEAFAFIGRISYPMYLYHWPIFAFSRWTWGLEDPGPIVVAIATVAVFSLFSYHIVEKPVREWRPKYPPSEEHPKGQTNNARVFMALAVALTISSTWFGLLNGPLHGALYGGEEEASETCADTLAGLQGPLRGCGCDLKSSPPFKYHAACAIADAPGLPPCFVDLPLCTGPIFASDCWSDRPAVGGDGPCPEIGGEYEDTRTRCLTADPARPTIFAIGDSHMLMLLPMIEEAVRGVYSVRAAGSLCACGACTDHDDDLAAIVRGQLRAGDIVAVSYWEHNIHGPDGESILNVQYKAYLQRLAAATSAASASLILMGDSHPLPWSPVGCREWKDCAFPRADADTAYAPLDALLTDLAGADGTSYFNWNHLFCDEASEGDCYANVPGSKVTAYVDYHHLNVGGAWYLWPHFCQWMVDSGLLNSTNATEA